MRAPRPSAPRNYRYARKWHAALIAQLGGRCAWCSATTRLELDHKNGRTWTPRLVSWHRRIKRYREEAAAGLLQVLCKSHNALKGNLVEKPARRPPAPGLDLDREPAWVRES